jgi:hypothetical protein
MMVRASPRFEHSLVVKALLDEAKECNKQDIAQLIMIQNNVSRHFPGNPHSIFS